MQHEQYLSWEDAHWEESEYYNYRKYKRWFITVPFKGMHMHTYIGEVKQTNDGRYRWYKRGQNGGFCNLVRSGKMEGVCSTLEEAQKKATEDLWN